jgi:hypothetical protein
MAPHHRVTVAGQTYGRDAASRVPPTATMLATAPTRVDADDDRAARRIAIRLLPHPPWRSKRQPGKRPESRRRLAEHPRPGVTDCGVPFPTPPDSGHILFVEYQWEPSRGSRARKRRLSGAVAARRVLSAGAVESVPISGVSQVLCCLLAGSIGKYRIMLSSVVFTPAFIRYDLR